MEPILGLVVRHRLAGHINPHCLTCGRTPMQIQKTPTAPCRRASLPFDDAAAIVLAPATIAPLARAGAA